MPSARDCGQLMRTALTLMVSLSLPLGAQQQPTHHTVRGTVFDSVAGKPLAGALVQIAASGSASTPLTATTDALGRYRVGGIPSGQFFVGFYHDALTALGLDGPTQAIALAADTLVTVNLAIPSSAAVRALRCGDMSPFAPGMLVGTLRDAESHGAIAGAKATLSWGALALDAGNYRTVTQQENAQIGEDGSFVVCNLPVDAPLQLVVAAPGHRSLEGSVVDIPASGIARLDLQLANSSLTSGAAMVRGRVTRESGKTVASGVVAIKALNRETPFVDGTFTIANLPAGTWVAEARVIGAEPRATMVTASDSAVASETIKVSNTVQRLEAVTVVGAPDRNTLLLNDVLRRKRIGSGTSFLPGSPALQAAHFTTDVMREARGFVYQGPNKILGRENGIKGRCTTVAVYLNDIRQPDGFEGIDAAAPVGEVLAIETWPDITMAPVQYRGSGMGKLAGRNMPPGIARLGAAVSPEACALVLVWTRR